MEKIEDEHYFYSLWHDPVTDEYFLDVLCGTVAQYTRVVKLTPEEVAEYKANPASIRAFADKVGYSPSNYAERHIESFDTGK